MYYIYAKSLHVLSEFVVHIIKINEVELNLLNGIVGHEVFSIHHVFILSRELFN